MALLVTWPLCAQPRLAREIFKELIEINTTDSTGDNTRAAETLAARFRAAGFPDSDIHVLAPAPRKGNLIVRFRGSGAEPPILLLGHLDVVEAKRSDWSFDPFDFREQDGYFYGRATQDMKADDAILVANFLRLKHEGFTPSRDLILALTADEEGGAFNGVEWLVKNHPSLIDAAYCINTDAGGGVPQSATAVVNCRILPNDTPAEVERTLKDILADPQIKISPMGAASISPVSTLDPKVVAERTAVAASIWPGTPIIPGMGTGATDGKYLRIAGIPTYGVSGIFTEENDVRAHGRDERIIVKSFYDALDFMYKLIHALGK